MTTKLETLNSSLFVTISDDHAAVLLGGLLAHGTGEVMATFESGSGTSSGKDYVTD